MRGSLSGLGSTLVALAMVMGAGCTAGVGTSESDLFAVQGDIESRRDLYLDAALDSRPLTAAQFDVLYGGLTESAVPVEIEILDVAAVAWLRHEDGTVSRTRADVVALWRVDGVIDFSTATTIDGEVDNIPGGPVFVPGSRVVEAGGIPRDIGDNDLNVDDFVVIDFFDRLDTAIFTEPEIFQDFNEAHPGCA
jgi:hypothetical protein